MSQNGGGKTRNEQFLTSLAEELEDTPVSELLDGESPEEVRSATARIVESSQRDAERRRRTAPGRRTPAAKVRPLEEAARCEDEGTED